MRYRTIVADPPWPFQWNGGAGGRRRRKTALGYTPMSLDDIAGLPVAEAAEDDSALLLWVTSQLNREGVGARVARAWGFEPVGEFVWRKPNYGTGAFPRAGHEMVLVCKRGRGLADAPRNVHSVQTWGQRRAPNNGGKVHSAKPDGFIDLVERSLPGPYLEMFARRARFGWDYWGDQSLGTARLVVPSTDG